MDYDLEQVRKDFARPCKYQVRKDGQPCAGWDDPACTPDRATLKSMKTAGYRLYLDGKLQR